METIQTNDYNIITTKLCTQIVDSFSVNICEDITHIVLVGLYGQS